MYPGSLKVVTKNNPKHRAASPAVTSVMDGEMSRQIALAGSTKKNIVGAKSVVHKHMLYPQSFPGPHEKAPRNIDRVVPGHI